MDTYEYIKWIHMGAQEPGTGQKLAAGPGSLAHGACRQFWVRAWLLGPHMYPFYVFICVHVYPYVFISNAFGQHPPQRKPQAGVVSCGVVVCVVLCCALLLFLARSCPKATPI